MSASARVADAHVVFRRKRREIDPLRFALVLGSAGEEELRDDHDVEAMSRRILLSEALCRSAELRRPAKSSGGDLASPVCARSALRRPNREAFRVARALQRGSARTRDPADLAGFKPGFNRRVRLPSPAVALTRSRLRRSGDMSSFARFDDRSSSTSSPPPRSSASRTRASRASRARRRWRCCCSARLHRTRAADRTRVRAGGVGVHDGAAERVSAEVGAPPPQNRMLSDIAFQMIPWRQALRQAMIEHEWPLWNRFEGCGDVLAGAAQAAPFSPFTLDRVAPSGRGELRLHGVDRVLPRRDRSVSAGARAWMQRAGVAHRARRSSRFPRRSRCRFSGRSDSRGRFCRSCCWRRGASSSRHRSDPRRS